MTFAPVRFWGEALVPKGTWKGDMEMQEWHYYSDKRHSWCKENAEKNPEPHKDSSHVAGQGCHRLCKEGLWPFPTELLEKAAEGMPDGALKPFHGPYADSWWVEHDGRQFKMIRHVYGDDRRTSSVTVVEMQWRLFNKYAHIPGMENTPPEWGWGGVQSDYHSYR